MLLVLGRTQFVGSEFGIFRGFGWVRSLVLVGEPGFGRVQSSTSRVRSSSKFKDFSKMFNILVGFVGSEFGIFGGFGWVRSSVLVGKPGFGGVRSSDLEFGELWRTLDIIFWAQNQLIFGQIWVNNLTFCTIF